MINYSDLVPINYFQKDLKVNSYAHAFYFKRLTYYFSYV